MVHAFEYDGNYFALDVETGSVHLLDKPAYDALAALERLEADGGDLSAALAADDPVMAELRELRDEGLLFSLPDEDVTTPVSVVKAMCLHLAHDCNLRCAYCFAKGGAFAGRRELMSESVAHAAIDWLVKASGARRNLEVDFFGGEPLMNFEVLKSTVKYARSLEAAHSKRFRFTLTTNAYEVTDEMRAYIEENMHNVVVSIDGRPHVHDAVRKAADGGGSYERIRRNAQALLLNRKGEYYVRGTFTARNLDFAEDVLHIADMGFAGVSIEPVVTTGANAIKEEHLPAIFAEYDRLAKEYAKRRREGRGFTFFHFMVDLNAGPCKLKRIRGCGAGAEYVAITPAGDIFPCHQFVGRPEYRMGHVNKDGLDKELADLFFSCNIDNMDSCKKCWAKYHCSGGCAAANVNINGDILKPYEIGCAMQKKRLEIAIGLAATEQMEEEA
ncbi:MAG: thioether cross-link-forming SCIFF peptide maturase [Christensenellaceae bacterium]|nr:thioether cross-link-forming SCIFF peptide maturase [Christensenellaceae bacterium]